MIDNVAKLKSTALILDVAVEQQKLKVVGGIYRLRVAGCRWPLNIFAESAELLKGKAD